LNEEDDLNHWFFDQDGSYRRVSMSGENFKKYIPVSQYLSFSNYRSEDFYPKFSKIVIEPNGSPFIKKSTLEENEFLLFVSFSYGKGESHPLEIIDGLAIIDKLKVEKNSKIYINYIFKLNIPIATFSIVRSYSICVARWGSPCFITGDYKKSKRLTMSKYRKRTLGRIRKSVFDFDCKNSVTFDNYLKESEVVF